MSQIKIKYQVLLSLYGKTVKTKPGNYCRGCGAPLKDPESIRRGYGARCWKDVPKAIILEIPPGEKKESS